MYKVNNGETGRRFPSVEMALRSTKILFRNQEDASFSVFHADDEGNWEPYASAIKRRWEWETVRYFHGERS